MTLGLWRSPDFAKLWSGQVVSEVGSVVSGTAIPIAAVLALHAAPLQMAFLVLATASGVICASFAAGVWADRVRRRPLLIAADLGRALLLAALALAAFAGALEMHHVYVVAFVNAALGAFFHVAYRSYVPSLVGRDALLEANAKLESGVAAAWVVGPSLGGALVQLITIPVTIFLDAFSFVVSAVSILWIRSPEPAPVKRVERTAPRREWLEGLRVSWHEPSLRAMLTAKVTHRLFGSFFAALYTLYALEELRLSPLLLGIAVSLGGVSSLAGGLAARRVLQRFGVANALIWGGLIASVASFGTPFAFGPPLVAASFLFVGQLVGDGIDTISEVATTTLRQSIAPSEVLGRVNSVHHFLVEGVGYLGALVGAVLAEAFGIRVAVLVAVLGASLRLVFLIASPIRRMRALPAAPRGLATEVAT